MEGSLLGKICILLQSKDLERLGMLFWIMRIEMLNWRAQSYYKVEHIGRSGCLSRIHPFLVILWHKHGNVCRVRNC